MSEESTQKKSRKINKSAKKVAGSAKNFLKKPIAKKLLVVLLVVACAYGIFYLGQQNGIAKQREIDKKSITSSRDRLMSRPTDRPSAIQNRKTFVGTVASISDKEIEVTPRTGDKVKIVLTGTIRITGSDGKKTDIKSVKKNQKVIVSTTKDKDGKYTASRIRIQK